MREEQVRRAVSFLIELLREHPKASDEEIWALFREALPQLRREIAEQDANIKPEMEDALVGRGDLN